MTMKNIQYIHLDQGDVESALREYVLKLFPETPRGSIMEFAHPESWKFSVTMETKCPKQ